MMIPVIFLVSTGFSRVIRRWGRASVARRTSARPAAREASAMGAIVVLCSERKREVNSRNELRLRGVMTQFGW